MNKLSMRPFLFFTLLGVVATSAFAEDARLDKLTDEHRKWLEEEVVYIITDLEREVFLSIDTFEERQRLIDVFWRKRDPNRATPLNEFKEEHYARIEYANKFLGRETSSPGWRTDRGRYYIILGEPREMQRYDGYAELVSTELWFYQGEGRSGLPSAFYLMFFKRNDFGEYRLYSPTIDGPGRLLQAHYGGSGLTGAKAAVEMLGKITPELARASLGFDISEPTDYITAQPSLGTPFLLARIEESPKRAIRTDYADAWFRYGNRVSADYSFNFVPNGNAFAVLLGPQSTPFVHFSIELDPENFTLETDEGQTTFYTTLDVSVEARDGEGNLVLASNREDYLELTGSQFGQIRASPFAYQDDFPLVPGDYTVSVILRNRVVRQYTVAEREIHIPVFDPQTPALSDVVLGFNSELKGGDVGEGEMRTFQVGNLRILPAAESLFALGDTVHAMLQVVGGDPEHQLRFQLRSGEEVLQERITRVGDYQGWAVVEQFPLFRMAGGYYTLGVQLLDSSGKPLAESSADLQVSPRTSIPRANFVRRRGFNARVPGLLAMARGDQLLNLGRLEEARAEFETAVGAGNPNLPMARWKLANLLLREGNAERVIELLSPLETDFPNQFEVVAGLGYAFNLKRDHSTALSYLERAIRIRPPDIMLLNALADSYQQTGKLDQAKEIFKRSLEMDPDQIAVQERLSSLSSGEGAN